MKHRISHYSMLKGRGVEIGALHEPAPVPLGCEVSYFDVRSREDSIRLFDELDPSEIVEVDTVGDADNRDIRKLGCESLDFVIANHVIEHLANPLAFLEDLFYVVKPGALVVLSAPDKRYTYDSKRGITSFEHLLNDYHVKERRPSEVHYLDFIEKVLPGGAEKTGAELSDLLELVYQRREHVHVWDTEAFCSFLERGLDCLNIRASPVVELRGEKTSFEYFSIWRKAERSGLKRLISFFRRG